MFLKQRARRPTTAEPLGGPLAAPVIAHPSTGRVACNALPAHPVADRALGGARLHRASTTLLMLGGCLSMSAGNVGGKALLPHVAVLPLVFVQLLSGTVLVWLIAAWRGRLPRKRAHLRLSLPGILQPGLVYLLSFLGLAVTPVSVQGFLFAFEAAIVALLAWPLLGERPTAHITLALLLGTAGVLLISASRLEAGVPVLGVALIMAGVLCAALDTIASRALAVNADPLTLTAAADAAGLAVVTAVLFVSGPHSWAFLASSTTVLGLASTGFLLAGLGPILFNAALRHVTASRAAAMFPLMSLLTALGGVLFLGERLTRVQVGGGTLIVVAALALARESRADDPKGDHI